MRTWNQRVSWIMGGILLAPMMGVAADSGSSDQLESIIVVGQKENQGIERAPEAITALPAEVLQQNQVRSAEDLDGMVPSLVIGESDGYNFDLSIRGIGLNSPQDDGSPGVGLRSSERNIHPEPARPELELSGRRPHRGAARAAGHRIRTKRGRRHAQHHYRSADLRRGQGILRRGVRLLRSDAPAHGDQSAALEHALRSVLPATSSSRTAM